MRAAPDGSFTYLVDLPPEDLPPVRPRDLEAAWDAAREAALGARWGAPRDFRFRREDGSFTSLMLCDRDAACWAGAVERTVGLRTSYGLSLGLRLLALVDLLARAGWTRGLWNPGRARADLPASLLRAAASAPLTPEGRFDEASFRARIAAPAIRRLIDDKRLTGALA